MTTEPDTITIGGHRVGHTGTPRAGRTYYTCVDCGLSDEGTTLFQVGTDGCPMRPESLDYLSVCPGGKLCGGHMDTSTHEYRMWKESPNMPKEQVPHFTCDASLLGIRAARQWLRFAGKIEMKVSDWSQEAYASHTGATGGKVADFATPTGQYHIVVTKYGKLRAHTGLSVLGCDGCAALADKGDVG